MTLYCIFPAHNEMIMLQETLMINHANKLNITKMVQ
jgi:hypothetical protein